jgi:hypothetical protein
MRSLSVLGLVTVLGSVSQQAYGMSYPEQMMTLQAEPIVECLDCGPVDFLDPALRVSATKNKDDRNDWAELLATDDKDVFPRLNMDDLIRLGQETWKFISDNRPVIEATSASVSVVPKGNINWDEFSQWKMPESRTFRVVYKNLLNWDVINFSYRVQYTPGGQYKKHGAYLSHVTVVPDTISALWGFTVEAEASVPSIVNLGTEKDPVAGAEIIVEWKAKSLVSAFHQTKSFFVGGNGQFKVLDGSPAVSSK